MEEQLKKIEATAGKDIAESLRAHIEEAMPHYEYLKQFAM